MKLAIGIVISVIWFLFIGETKITFSPFSISIDSWPRAVGYLLIMWGVAFLSVGEYQRGRLKGQDEAFDAVNELLDKKIQEDNK